MGPVLLSHWRLIHSGEKRRQVLRSVECKSVQQSCTLELGALRRSSERRDKKRPLCPHLPFALPHLAHLVLGNTMQPKILSSHAMPIAHHFSELEAHHQIQSYNILLSRM